MPDLVGQQFGKYRIIGLVGRGGMADVYRARDTSLERDVAVKILASQFAADPEFVARFRREAVVIASLRNPAILAVYDFGQLDAAVYMAMELLGGGTLSARLQRGQMAFPELIRILAPVAAALDYAHRRGVLHRDVKPSNIGFDEAGEPYLMDFGLAYLAQADTKLTRTGAMMGTPAYMAPEQISGNAVSPATDLYALGIVAFEALTGQVPFHSDSTYAVLLSQVQQAPPLPSQLRPGLSTAVDSVFLKVLAKNPTDRFESATAFVDALRAAVGEDVSVPAPARAASPPAAVPAASEVALPSLGPSPYAPPAARPESVWARLKRSMGGLLGRRQAAAPAAAADPAPVSGPAPALPPPGAGASEAETVILYPPAEALPPTQVLTEPLRRELDWPEPAGEVPGMETILARPPVAESILARGSPSLILHPEIIDLLAPVGKSTLAELLSLQEPERIVDYIVNFGSGRFIIAGYGSFGGTSLTQEICRSIRRGLSEAVARRSAGLMVMRLNTMETVYDRPAVWEASAQGFTGDSLPIGQFAAGTGTAPNGAQPLSRLFDTLADLRSGRRLASDLGATLGKVVIPQGALTHLVLVLDKVLQIEMLDELLNHPLLGQDGVTCLVVTEHEHYNRWPAEAVRVLKSRWKFQEWSVPCLWESESGFVQKTMERLFSSFLMDSPEAAGKYRAFQGHLAYVGRGQVGTTLYELRQLRYWQIDRATGQAFIALDALDDDLIAQHRWVQDLLEGNWPRILGSSFVGREQTDRAKLGVYSLMDWIIDAATFTLDEILEEAERRPVIIADRKRKRDLAVGRLLKVLEDNHYLGRASNSFDVIWGRDITDGEARAAVHAADMSRARSLERRREDLQREYDAVSGQLGKVLSDLDRLRLQRELDDLDTQIARVDDELKMLL